MKLLFGKHKGKEVVDILFSNNESMYSYGKWLVEDNILKGYYKREQDTLIQEKCGIVEKYLELCNDKLELYKRQCNTKYEELRDGYRHKIESNKYSSSFKEENPELYNMYDYPEYY